LSTITAQAPPFRTPIAQAGTGHDKQAADGSPEKDRPEFGDFELLRVLGEGSFGKVYLARQISLDRQVALKVTGNRGSEARTLASLEHDHIVQVFSETVDTARNQRILCMQYVPGTTLERVIGALNEWPRDTWSGRAILQAIDSLSQHPAAFHPSALRDRELLAESDLFQAVCWFGARLAEALDYAHTHGVLHRDVKPANVLVSPYGRPLLADFNISLQAARAAQLDDVFGGTLGYMAPEHLDAFNPDGATPHNAVDERSDIYSLGVLLFEMLTGHRPFDQSPGGSDYSEYLRDMAVARRTLVPSPRDHRHEVPDVLARIVVRCLDPDPRRRYQGGAELARALDGCRELRQAEVELPDAGQLTRAALRHPFWLIALLALVPHVLGSVVNILYNNGQIVGQLSPTQATAFIHMVVGYNLIVYPICVWLLIRAALPAYWLFRELRRNSRTLEPGQFDEVRRQVQRWPLWVVCLSCAGWIPGGLVFPVGLSMLAEPVRADVFLHFLFSFTISGLIAMTYSFFGVQYVALRVFYWRLWYDAQDFRSRARVELANIPQKLWWFQICSGAIPLLGAILLVSVEDEVSAYRTFRALFTGLIGLGMAGFALAVQANNLTVRTLAAFAGTEGKRSTTGPATPDRTLRRPME
jgi:serine/threonine protein kinase